MGKPANSIQIKKDHSRFGEVCAALGVSPDGRNSVYVSPDRAIYPTLVGSAPLVAEHAAPLTREEKRERIESALAHKEAIALASNDYEWARTELERCSAVKAKAYSAYRENMAGFDAVIPSGHSFKFGGVQYTHLNGELIRFDDMAEDFDSAPNVEPAPEPVPKVEPAPEPVPKVEPAPEPVPKVEPAPEPVPKVEPVQQGTKHAKKR
jgi:hypothetical protein